LLLPLLPPL
nr:Chain C, Insulin-like growth factor-binding protein-like 1 peptide [Homo sapiens]